LGEGARLVKALQPGLAGGMAKDEERERRLAAALRENLRKRKARERGDASEVGEKKKLDPGSRPG
jgi:hypothetical protein